LSIYKKLKTLFILNVMSLILVFRVVQGYIISEARLTDLCPL